MGSYVCDMAPQHISTFHRDGCVLGCALTKANCQGNTGPSLLLLLNKHTPVFIAKKPHVWVNLDPQCAPLGYQHRE